MEFFNLLDLSQAESQAFWNGFFQGLPGASMLESFDLKIKIPSELLKPLRKQITNPTDAIRSDWEQVGNDLRAAIRQYEQ